MEMLLSKERAQALDALGQDWPWCAQGDAKMARCAEGGTWQQLHARRVAELGRKLEIGPGTVTLHPG
jgi:hypothetical protein